jgi:hypothetical protein
MKPLPDIGYYIDAFLGFVEDIILSGWIWIFISLIAIIVFFVLVMR